MVTNGDRVLPDLAQLCQLAVQIPMICVKQGDLLVNIGASLGCRWGCLFQIVSLAIGSSLVPVATLV
jgi:hypothetical protein